MRGRCSASLSTARGAALRERRGVASSCSRISAVSRDSVTCGRCRDSFFLHVEFAGSIVNAVEEVTRVAAPSPRDTDEIEGDPLTHDEVLDAHQRLSAFSGKLTDLLED